MKRTMAICAVAQVALMAAVGAQESPAAPAPPGWSRGIVHFGKWVTTATALGLTILAAREHASAEDNWRQLIAMCRNDNASCQLRGDGRYVDYNTELLFQRTTYYDRRARSRLIEGQVALLASAALFIMDLRHQGGNPPNIPYHGLKLAAEPTAGGVRLGLRLAF